VTESISRKFLGQVLLLYPEPFRHEFGNEMLNVFEECRRTHSAWRLFADVVLSAVKQQFRYLSTPAPKNAPLYAEIALSPNLARMLAVVVFSAALIAGVSLGEKPKAPEPWTLIRPERRFWPSAGQCQQYCFYPKLARVWPYTTPTEP
jgi:hypothetical protein